MPLAVVLALVFVPSVLIGIFIGRREGASEGFAAFMCSALLNAMFAYGWTH